MPRTEAEMISKAPVKVKLGETEYSIPVLTILPSREWRIKLNQELGEVVDSFQSVGSIDSEAFGRGLASALLHFPEKMAKLIFEYAGDSLPKDEILAAATEEQIGTAFSRIMEVAFPLVPLQMAIRAARITALPATAKSSN